MPDDPSDERNAAIEPEADAPPAAAFESNEPIGPTFDLSIFIEPPGILCHFQCEGRMRSGRCPARSSAAHKAMSVDHVFDLLGAGPILGYFLREAVTNEPEFLMVPRAVNALTDRVTKVLRQVRKELLREANAAAAEAALTDRL